eukprot:3781289-Rhodomonas_salina.1
MTRTSLGLGRLEGLSLGRWEGLYIGRGGERLRKCRWERLRKGSLLCQVSFWGVGSRCSPACDCSIPTVKSMRRFHPTVTRVRLLDPKRHKHATLRSHPSQTCGCSIPAVTGLRLFDSAHILNPKTRCCALKHRILQPRTRHRLCPSDSVSEILCPKPSQVWCCNYLIGSLVGALEIATSLLNIRLRDWIPPAIRRGSC